MTAKSRPRCVDGDFNKRSTFSRKINLYIIYGSEKAQGSKEGNKEGGEKAPIVPRKIPPHGGIFLFM